MAPLDSASEETLQKRRLSYTATKYREGATELNPALFLLVAGGLMATLSLLAALNFLMREKDMGEPELQQAENA